MSGIDETSLFCSELESGNDKLAIHTPMSIIAI